MPDLPEVIAVHEAGHAVAALAAGGIVHEVDMTADPPTVWACYCDEHTEAPVSRLDEAAFTLAGLAAETLIGPPRPEFARLELADLEADGRDAADLIDVHDLDVVTVAIRAVHLVAAHRAAVLDLAAYLATADHVPGRVLAGWWAAWTRADLGRHPRGSSLAVTSRGGDVSCDLGSSAESSFPQVSALSAGGLGVSRDHPPGVSRTGGHDA